MTNEEIEKTIELLEKRIEVLETISNTKKSGDISVVLEGFGNRTTLCFSKETWNGIAKVVSEAWRGK